jgi:hypothetical protein
MSTTPEFVAKAHTLTSAGGSSDCAGGELRSYKERVDEANWYSPHQEAESKIRLIEAEARRALAEARRTEAEGRRLEAERVDIEFGVIRKVVYLAIALVMSLAVFVNLLLDPAALLSASGGISIVALLGWLTKRAGASD